jgi:hypothetical protein
MPHEEKAKPDSVCRCQRTRANQLANTARATESTLPTKMTQPMVLCFIADPPSYIASPIAGYTHTYRPQSTAKLDNR